LVSGASPKPRGSLREDLGSEQSSAKQNYAFCFFFWKKKRNIKRELKVILLFLRELISGASARPCGSLREGLLIEQTLGNNNAKICLFLYYWMKARNPGIVQNVCI
jgi:hypothetical protein